LDLEAAWGECDWAKSKFLRCGSDFADGAVVFGHQGIGGEEDDSFQDGLSDKKPVEGVFVE
jgi:hypothetical protein